jgi:hypothetical protein
VNIPSFTRVKPFIERAVVASVTVVFSTVVIGFAVPASADWSIDFSRRTGKMRDADLGAALKASGRESSQGGRQPASVSASSASGDMESGEAKNGAEVDKSGVLDLIFDAGEPMQDVVILHTEKGFVPSTVRVRKGGRYRVHVVNVNEKEKNVSFILDGFSEHHATYYGNIKVFMLEPKKEGTYSFQSPETSSEGKLIVFNSQTGAQPSVRAPASRE